MPEYDYNLVALAPWLSPACTLAYLSAAQRVNTQAFIFFLPDNTTLEPPEENNVKWELGDGGEWKSDNPYPVYVVPGLTGYDLVTATAQYSGDLASVPHGDELLNEFDSRELLRLYVDVDTGKSGSSTYQYHSSVSVDTSLLQSARGNVGAKNILTVVAQALELDYQVYGSFYWSFLRFYYL